MGIDRSSSSKKDRASHYTHDRQEPPDHAAIARERQRNELSKHTARNPAVPCEVIDLTQDSPPRKRKRALEEETPNTKAVRYDAPASSSAPQKSSPEKGKDEEKRLIRWRKAPPLSYIKVRDRALTQRMFALDRKREFEDSECLREIVTLAGTTGNVYTITIDKVPSCNCPHALKGNQCKHICYVLTRILRVRADLEYQLAFTSAELREIFANAPPLPSETSQNSDGNRKPIEGECPICMVDLDPESGEQILYCQAACGNNIHKECFDQWAASKRGSTVTCPFCRAPWQSSGSELKNLSDSAACNDEGYVNVAGQLGLSGRRDYSSYHSHWVRRQVRRGFIEWDDDGVMDHEYYE